MKSTRLIHWYGRIAPYAGALTLIALMSGCKLTDIVGNGKLPPNVVDPVVAKTKSGATSAYISTLVYLREAVGYGGRESYVGVTGLLTDELHELSTGGLPGFVEEGNIDARTLSFDRFGMMVTLYQRLQRVRGYASQTRGLLNDYYPAGKGPLIAHMYAVSGYAELMLAEGFCSGIPLSTLDYNGDYTYKPGSSTDEVLDHAVALFDSAIALAGDSAQVLNFARVGKGRALLQLGQFEAAATAVVNVPDDFRYDLMYNRAAGAYGLQPQHPNERAFFATGNKEGVNGLPFVTEHDARLPDSVTWNRSPSPSEIISVIPDAHVVRLASGVEARLIRAEAALKAGDGSWLTILNDLRANGGVAGLAPLTDPVDAMERLDTLFRERGYWLYLTGHRQGDLRRLIKRHRRGAQEQIYPTGSYPGTLGSYGGDVTLLVPADESRINPLYSGCLNRDA